MNQESLFTRFSGYQERLLNTVKSFGERGYKFQFHPDLSPAGWHLGHCVFMEDYWIREQVLGQAEDNSPLQSLYVTELSPKAHRTQFLPGYTELCGWAEHKQQENKQLLTNLSGNQTVHELLRNNFLVNFLLQHYGQHCETVALIQIQKAIKEQTAYTVTLPLQGTPVAAHRVTVPAGEYRIGAEPDYAPYDNEFPAFSISLNEFQIAEEPVSNSNFLAFMQDGGYENREYWCEGGWQWRMEKATGHPDHWRKDKSGYWFGHDTDGPCELTMGAPVYGINYYEAGAFARWAGGRLPHEYEWEAASRLGFLTATGQVWEWCINDFHPYRGFKAFPYDGYSTPYFDQRHYTLKGGSRYSYPGIKRPTFRNFYEADKRHIHAGLRLAYD